MSCFTDEEGDLDLGFSKISPNQLPDAEQNTGLFSALQVLAEKPELIENIFLKKGDEENKMTYALQLYKYGEKTVVIIDDYIITHDEEPLTMSTLSEGSNAWVFFIEKARAKMHGTYMDSMNLGQTSEQIFVELTGAETNCFEINNDQFEKI